MQLQETVFSKLMATRAGTLSEFYEAARECGVDPSKVQIVFVPHIPGEDTPPLRLLFGPRTTAFLDRMSKSPAKVERFDQSPVARESCPAKPGIVLYTRSPRDRALLDQIVMQSLMRAGDWTVVERLDVYGKRGLETVVGLKQPITTKQLRESLRRLAARRVIERRGQARGTQYRVKTKKKGGRHAPGGLS